MCKQWIRYQFSQVVWQTCYFMKCFIIMPFFVNIFCQFKYTMVSVVTLFLDNGSLFSIIINNSSPNEQVFALLKRKPGHRINRYSCPYVTKYARIVVHKWNWNTVRKQMSTVNLNNLYAWGNQLVNKLGQDIIPTNNKNSFWADKVEIFKIATKFYDDPLKNIFLKQSAQC
mgnify:CR=1 FL=1